METGHNLLDRGMEVSTKTWQGIDVHKTMIENFEYVFQVPIVVNSVEAAELTGCDKEWAYIHFQERIGGKPLNPGESYKIWPHYKEDELWREDSQFSHTYMERFWPKLAGDEQKVIQPKNHRGIRYEYGDLKDVINLLRRDIHTRQAFLPIWFPEDTGAQAHQRLPCTLGYLFNYRNGFFHISYYIRSCDFVRHFQNDLYLTNELASYVIKDLKRFFLTQFPIESGLITFHCASMHCFKQEKFRVEQILEKLYAQNDNL